MVPIDIICSGCQSHITRDEIVKLKIIRNGNDFYCAACKTKILHAISAEVSPVKLKVYDRSLEDTVVPVLDVDLRKNTAGTWFLKSVVIIVALALCAFLIKTAFFSTEKEDPKPAPPTTNTNVSSRTTQSSSQVSRMEFNLSLCSGKIREGTSVYFWDEASGMEPQPVALRDIFPFKGTYRLEFRKNGYKPVTFEMDLRGDAPKPALEQVVKTITYELTDEMKGRISRVSNLIDEENFDSATTEVNALKDIDSKLVTVEELEGKIGERTGALKLLDQSFVEMRAGLADGADISKKVQESEDFARKNGIMKSFGMRKARIDVVAGEFADFFRAAGAADHAAADKSLESLIKEVPSGSRIRHMKELKEELAKIVDIIASFESQMNGCDRRAIEERFITFCQKNVVEKLAAEKFFEDGRVQSFKLDVANCEIKDDAACVSGEWKLSYQVILDEKPVFVSGVVSVGSRKLSLKKVENVWKVVDYGN